MIILGPENAGKTSLFLRYAYFDPKSATDYSFEKQTSSAAYVLSKWTESDEKVKILSLWDISSKQGFLDNIKEYYSDTEVACLLFDVTDPATFKECQIWAQEIKEIVPKVIIVANKIDLVDDRKVSFEDAQSYANNN